MHGVQQQRDAAPASDAASPRPGRRRGEVRAALRRAVPRTACAAAFRRAGSRAAGRGSRSTTSARRSACPGTPADRVRSGRSAPVACAGAPDRPCPRGRRWPRRNDLLGVGRSRPAPRRPSRCECACRRPSARSRIRRPSSAASRARAGATRSISTAKRRHQRRPGRWPRERCAGRCRGWCRRKSAPSRWPAGSARRCW